MRELIAQEKGDDDPWDLKLARGGLTDLDFIAQGLVLAHPDKIDTQPGASTPQVIAAASESGLLSPTDSQTLLEAHHTLSDVFQWQRLMVEGPFDAAVAIASNSPATRYGRGPSFRGGDAAESWPAAR